jgi:hypothetical protein
MSFADRLIIFVGICVAAIESRKRLRVKLSVISAGARECFGKARWL